MRKVISIEKRKLFANRVQVDSILFPTVMNKTADVTLRVSSRLFYL